MIETPHDLAELARQLDLCPFACLFLCVVHELSQFLCLPLPQVFVSGQSKSSLVRTPKPSLRNKNLECIVSLMTWFPVVVCAMAPVVTERYRWYFRWLFNPLTLRFHAPSLHGSMFQRLSLGCVLLLSLPVPFSLPKP